MQRLGTHRWLLRQPVAIEGPAVLKVHHATLLIGPGAFLEVRKRGTLDLRSVHVTGVGLDRRPMTRPLPSRGFLVATEEGRLVLERDVITDLGHLGDLSYGISIRQSGRGSRITGSTIRDNYFGIYTSHGLGMRITGNRVIDSVVYGIDPQLESRDILIQRNLVRGSGLHGIILSARDREIRVMDNRVMGSRLHGIVLYRGCRHNVVRENLIRHTFDGIVLTSVSHNLVAANTIREAVRFGMRISMGASHNVLRNNEIDDALLGAYLYGGARANRLLQNRFAHDRENVRVRSDAPGNRIRPVPPRSEVAP
jgi:nitrous oxidase accessory protein NosD